MKTCNRCDEDKPLDQFYASKRNLHGVANTCKGCIKAKRAVERCCPEARAKRRDYDLRRCYGIDSAEYATMLELQGGECRVCGAPDLVGGKHLAVDHCHKTGEVRGLLCDQCNVGLGKFLDDPALLRAALDYLLE